MTSSSAPSVLAPVVKIGLKVDGIMYAQDTKQGSSSANNVLKAMGREKQAHVRIPGRDTDGNVHGCRHHGLWVHDVLGDKSALTLLPKLIEEALHGKVWAGRTSLMDSFVHKG